MNKPTYKDEVYIPTESEPWEKTQGKAEANGYEFFCESNHSEGPYSLFPYVKRVSSGNSVYLRYDKLEERLNPPTPIWETDAYKPDPFEEYANDAWKIYHDLLEKYTLKTEIRSDIKVYGHATDRSVELILIDYQSDKSKIKTKSTGKRNIATMRELARALNEACDFVEEQNPKWASHGQKDNDGSYG